jgi:hypothetical protein
LKKNAKLQIVIERHLPSNGEPKALKEQSQREAEIVKVYLRPKPKMKKTSFDFDFSTLAIKGRNSRGNILWKIPIKSITKREEGVSTLGARDIWYDETVRRLNTDERGKYVGAFKADDKIVTILSTGEFKLTSYDLSTHFDDEMIFIEKFDPAKIITAIYLDGEQKKYYLKRFQIPESSVVNKKYAFVPETKGSKLIAFSLDYLPRVEMELNPGKNNEIEFEIIPAADFIAVKSYKAKVSDELLALLEAWISKHQLTHDNFIFYPVQSYIPRHPIFREHINQYKTEFFFLQDFLSIHIPLRQ